MATIVPTVRTAARALASTQPAAANTDATPSSVTSVMPDVGQRPDVLAAAARVAAAEAALDTGRALQSRDLALGLRYEHFPPAGSPSPNNSWGLSVSVPLLVAHAYEGAIACALVELDAAYPS